MSRSLRLFTALELPDSVRDELGRVVDHLAQASGAHVKWTRPELMHVTLRFLGDVDEAAFDELTAALATVPFEPLELRVEGLGQFPPRGRPRVLWAGVGGAVDVAAHLKAEIDRVLLGLGFAPDGESMHRTHAEALLDEVGTHRARPFRPHVTIGRVRSPRAIDALVAECARIGERVRWEMPPIREFVLFESRLDEAGPRYHARWRSSISGSDDA